MASSIDDSVPATSAALASAPVRANFAAAKGEIEALQADSLNAEAIQGVGVDATAATPGDGDILVYRAAGADWVLEAKPAGGSNPAINDVTDITITAVVDNEVLAYDSTSGEWINQSAAEAGLATAGHSHAGVYEPAGVSAADLTDATAAGRTLLTAADAAAQRAALNVEDGAAADQSAAEVAVAATPTNYTAATADVEAHLAGLDTAIGGLGGGHDAVTLAGTPDYLSIDANQVITRGPIDLTADVTGTLPAANGGTGVSALTSLNLSALGSGSETVGLVPTASGAGAVVWDGRPHMSSGHRVGLNVISSAGASQTITLDGRTWVVTLDATTCALTLAIPAGWTKADCELIVKQDATGGRALTWTTSVASMGTQTMSTTANKRTRWILSTNDGGTSYLRTPAGVES